MRDDYFKKNIQRADSKNAIILKIVTRNIDYVYRIILLHW